MKTERSSRNELDLEGIPRDRSGFRFLVVSENSAHDAESGDRMEARIGGVMATRGGNPSDQHELIGQTKVHVRVGACPMTVRNTSYPTPLALIRSMRQEPEPTAR